MILPLPRSTPEEQGVASTALLGFIEAADQTIHDLHSVMLLRHGKVVAEGWWSPYEAARPHMLFSLSKSFTSTAIGMAVAEGRMTVDEHVLAFFPAEAPPTVSENLRAMRVRHLLSMSTGHAVDTTDALKTSAEGNWVKIFLAQPVEYAPGTHFLYNSGATFMLSAIIQKITGMRLLDYLTPRLMHPLGIEGATWELSPEGIHTGGWGLSIKTEDIARFGQLYLQKGNWEGRQLLSHSWVRDATSKQIDNGDDPKSDWAQGYGYQFWRCRHDLYRGDGAFGQFCIVMPEQDAVLAITSGVPDMQAVMNLAWDHLLPALKGASPLPPDTAGCDSLRRKLASLTLPPPQGRMTSPLAGRVSGRTYVLEANDLGLTGISFDFTTTSCTVTFRIGDKAFPLTCGLGIWRAGTLSILAPDAPVVASAVWSAADTLVITHRYTEAPFHYTTTCRFTGDDVAIDAVVNVAFGPTQWVLKGRQA